MNHPSKTSHELLGRLDFQGIYTFFLQKSWLGAAEMMLRKLTGAFSNAFFPDKNIEFQNEWKRLETESLPSSKHFSFLVLEKHEKFFFLGHSYERWMNPSC